MFQIRPIQIIYILVITIVIYIVYQLMLYKKPSIEDIQNNVQQPSRPGSKIIAFIIILFITSGYVIYFNIGLDELQLGGETKLRDLLQFEKSMIQNIQQEVNVGPPPF
jgi:hypothetical protein